MRHLRMVIIVLALSLLLPALAACGTATQTSNASDSTVRVTATLTMIGDMVRQVGGERVTVTTIMPVGLDPHSYEPVPGDVRNIAESEIIFANGLGIEKWLEELIANAGGERPLIYVAEPLRNEAFFEDHGGEQVPDPHTWNNVEFAIRYVDEIYSGLAMVDPDGAEQYKANAERYKAELARLHEWVLQTIATIPEQNRKLVTGHDAFRYLCERYGLEFFGSIWGVSTDEEPSAAQIDDLVRRLRDAQIPAVFVETSINPQFLQQVSRDAGVVVAQEPLYSDSLGREGSNGDTYIKMMVHNVSVITRNLGGSVNPFQS